VSPVGELSTGELSILELFGNSVKIIRGVIIIVVVCEISQISDMSNSRKLFYFLILNGVTY